MPYSYKLYAASEISPAPCVTYSPLRLLCRYSIIRCQVHFLHFKFVVGILLSCFVILLAYWCRFAVILLSYCCHIVVILLLYCWHIVVAMLLHCCSVVVILLSYCCHVVALLSCCCHIVGMLLLHCCHIVVALLLHCCHETATPKRYDALSEGVTNNKIVTTGFGYFSILSNRRTLHTGERHKRGLMWRNWLKEAGQRNKRIERSNRKTRRAYRAMRSSSKVCAMNSTTDGVRHELTAK